MICSDSTESMNPDISHQKFVELWGEENLVKLNAETLLDLKISKSCKIFLIEKGIPKNANEL